VDDLGERRIDRHWWNETEATAEGVTNEQAQAWLVRADDAGRLAKALLEARAEVEWLRVLVSDAYVEGYGHGVGGISGSMGGELAWTRSRARAALRGEGGAKT